jgi:hypothetical protein
MFVYDDMLYSSEEDAIAAIMRVHPELSDDALVEYAENHIEELDD